MNIIKYRDYICVDSSGQYFKETLNSVDPLKTVERIEMNHAFLKWIHTDWQELVID